MTSFSGRQKKGDLFRIHFVLGVVLKVVNIFKRYSEHDTLE